MHKTTWYYQWRVSSIQYSQPCCLVFLLSTFPLSIMPSVQLHPFIRQSKVHLQSGYSLVADYKIVRLAEDEMPPQPTEYERDSIVSFSPFIEDFSFEYFTILWYNICKLLDEPFFHSVLVVLRRRPPASFFCLLGLSVRSQLACSQVQWIWCRIRARQQTNYQLPPRSNGLLLRSKRSRRRNVLRRLGQPPRPKGSRSWRRLVFTPLTNTGSA